MPDIAELAPRAFFKHNHESERGMREVTRASAVFYFRRTAQMRTQIHYMNYWHEKRGLDCITRRLTLRDMAGTMFHQSELKVEGLGGFTIEINDILDSVPGAPDEGSVEIEFLAPVNIAIAYPAAIVRYLGDDWHTVAHSSQRYYSETSGDDPEMVGRIQLAEEGNITILEGGSAEPFVIAHNGPVAIDPAPVEVTVHSVDGDSISAQTEPLGWAPFQTRVLHLSELIEYRAFLAGRRGTFALRMLVGGVFPRMIGGNERNDQWSIDHTNFAATGGEGVADVIPMHGDEHFKELVFNLPNNVVAGWNCYADIYPTYPAKSGYTLEVREIDRDGAPRTLKRVPVASGGSDSFPRISMDNASAEGTNLEILFRHEREVPRRFHTGIHYQVGDGLPGFLTDGPLPHSTPPIRSRWFPVFEPGETENYLMIANRTIGDEPAQTVTYRVKLFNSHGDEPMVGEFTLEPWASTCLGVEDLIPGGIDFLRRKPGWFYIIASVPQRGVLHYASLRGTSSVAVCHAF